MVWELDCEEGWAPKNLVLLNCGVGEDSWESLGLQGDPTSPFWRRSALGFLWREWCWSWNTSTLATSREELTHWKSLWYWEGLGAGGEGDDREWDGWMVSLTQWTWVWVKLGSWWWTGRPRVLRFMGLQRVGPKWATSLSLSTTSRVQFSLVQFSHSVVSDSLQPHGLQHTRLLCSLPTPRVYPNSCPSSPWCHPTISSSVIPFSSHLQFFPASGSFPMS